MANSGTENRSHLSKNLMQMKFMRRSVIRLENEQNVEERQKIIDDEHWVLDIPELKEKESKYVFEPSYVPCQNLKFGRMSFKGFNPEIEKLTLAQDTEQKLAISEEKEIELAVDPDEMTKRYESLIGTIAKKFAKKRQRSGTKDNAEPDVKKFKPSKTGFMKPADD